MTCMVCLKYMSIVSIYCGSLTKKQQQEQKTKNNGTHTHYAKSQTKIIVIRTIKNKMKQNKMNNIDNTKTITINKKQ